LVEDTRARLSLAPALVTRAFVFVMVVLASIPLLTTTDPVWATGGKVDDASITAAGAYELTPLWIVGRRLLACAKPGDLVAYSEMGSAGFARHDLRFLDLRGLLDKEIARTAPASLKGEPGVTDYSWASSTSVVGRVIVREQPVLILSVDGLPSPTVLDGRYIEVQYLQFRNTPHFRNLPLVLYRRADRPCLAQVVRPA
jgi:hypothetical protein